MTLPTRYVIIDYEKDGTSIFAILFAGADGGAGGDRDQVPLHDLGVAEDR